MIICSSSTNKVYLCLETRASKRVSRRRKTHFEKSLEESLQDTLSGCPNSGQAPSDNSTSVIFLQTWLQRQKVFSFLFSFFCYCNFFFDWKLLQASFTFTPNGDDFLFLLLVFFSLQIMPLPPFNTWKGMSRMSTTVDKICSRLSAVY